MEEWLHPALRFAHYVLLLGLFGLTAFRTIGLRSLATSTTRGIAVAAWAAPLLSLALLFVGIAAMMGQPVSQLERATVEAMLVQTHFGWAFLARSGLLLTAALLLTRSSTRLQSSPISSLLYALALATLPWSGHASATEGAIGLLHRINDAAHLLAAGLWIGAIGWFLYLATLAHRADERVDPVSLLRLMTRFGPFGVLLVAIITLTGIINTVLIVGWDEIRAMLITNYGWLLIAKLAIVGLMLMCAARNAELSRRSANDIGFLHRQSTLKVLRLSLAMEIGLAVVALGLVAKLGLTTPMP